MSPESDPERRYRKSLRLKGYDYTWHGAYFVTIVTQYRACLFGTIENGVMTLSDAGKMIQAVWQTLPTRFQNIVLDAFVVMPNHFHGIIVFPAADPMVDTASASSVANNGEAEQRVPTRGTTTERTTLGDVVGAWKSLTTVAYISNVKAQGWKPFVGRLWQPNYYEHIVRNHEDLARIRYYVDTNPQYWIQDAENPQQVS